MELKEFAFSSFALVFIVFTRSVRGQGDVEIGCFVPGECQQSLFVDLNKTDSAAECLQFCKVGARVLLLFEAYTVNYEKCTIVSREFKQYRTFVSAEAKQNHFTPLLH